MQKKGMSWAVPSPSRDKKQSFKAKSEIPRSLKQKMSKDERKNGNKG